MSSNNVIDKTAMMGEGTTAGNFVVISKNVKIGKECAIGSHVVIHEGTVIGDNVRIDDNTVIGKQPMRAKRSIFKSEPMPPAEIGSHCLIGAQVVIYAGCKIADNILIADTAAIRENVSIGEYTIVGRGVTVENFCKVGKKCKLETGCYITAYSEIGDYCFIAPMVTTTNDNYLGRTEERFKHFKGVTVKKGGRIGGRAVILPGITIGEDAVVGAGSVVTRDVPAKQIFVGVPAKYFRDTPEEQLLENQGWE
ncbi:MAG: N-acetyltransferase [bacterium]|jgi:acetyltransferase-like isoleucine patch superfamily enzyme|nr:N-acetyltransferase [bacterium]